MGDGAAFGVAVVLAMRNIYESIQMGSNPIFSTMKIINIPESCLNLFEETKEKIQEIVKNQKRVTYREALAQVNKTYENKSITTRRNPPCPTSECKGDNRPPST